MDQVYLISRNKGLESRFGFLIFSISSTSICISLGCQVFMESVCFLLLDKINVILSFNVMTLQWKIIGMLSCC